MRLVGVREFDGGKRILTLELSKHYFLKDNFEKVPKVSIKDK